MIVLTHDQLIARLVGRLPLRVWGDGSVWIELKDAGLEDERVPAAYFEEMRSAGLIQEAAPGEWVISPQGRRRLGR